MTLARAKKSGALLNDLPSASGSPDTTTQLDYSDGLLKPALGVER